MLQELLAPPVDTNGLAPLEVASSIVLGDEPGVPEHLPAGGARDAVAELERSLLRALQRPPCLVSFSGGRDSSALLAVALRVARREGLSDPVAVTARFPGTVRTAEEGWQEQMVSHLGLSDWVRLDFGDELDLVGPVARGLMAREALPYPSNLHLMFPMLERAHGGTFVTGLGGDQTLVPAGRPLDVLAARVRPTPRDLLRVGFAMAPRPVRRPVLRRRGMLSFPWLRREANATLGHAWLEEELRQPLRWNARLRSSWRSRYMVLTIRRLGLMGAVAGAECVHPFTEPGFLAALAETGGRTGFESRTAAMRALFADALPPALVSRPTKASFNEVLWNRHTREFLAGTDDGMLATALGTLGLDEIVDLAALSRHWRGDEPLANSFLLLQACWLALSCEKAAG
jgi:Asparagine synthase